MEAIAVLEPRLGVDEGNNASGADNADSNPSLVYIGDSARPSRKIFSAPGSGYRLRSPSQVIFYLGQIVNETFAGIDPQKLSISARDGSLAPIFQVEIGAGTGAVTAEVDGEEYWLQPQKLGSTVEDFSHRSLTLVKDLIALNTLQAQIPKNTAIFVGGSQ